MATASSDSGSSSTGYLHHDLDHPTSSFCAFNTMRDNNQLCDISLRLSNGATIKAHRLVLASTSPYFHAMFNSDMAERSQSEVKLRELDPDAVQSLIEFSYTSQVIVTEENARKLLLASSFLQIDSVRDACCKFLINTLRPSNCLDTWQLAETQFCYELSVQSRGYAMQNFEEVAECEEFLGLSFDKVEDLVSDDNLCVLSEERVFEAVMRWVKHDPAGRSQCNVQLMRRMRLTQMSKKFFFDVVYKEQLVRNEPSCEDLLLNVAEYHLIPERRSNVSSMPTERRTGSPMPYVFAIGGKNGGGILKSGECYNPVVDRWLPIADMSQARNFVGIASLNNLIYALGGYNGYIDLSSAEFYNPAVNEWSAVTSMGSKRRALGVGVVDGGLLYACGGYNDSSILSSVERYDPIIDVWTSCPSMTTSRSNFRVSEVNSCLYAVGGYNRMHRYLSTAERYDPRMSKWMTIPDVCSPRLNFSMAPLDDMLYCVGGNHPRCPSRYCVGGNHPRCPSSGERFNVRRYAWEPIAHTLCDRSYHDMVAVDGGLLVLGGRGVNVALDSTERYEPQNDWWTMATPMTNCRRMFGATLLYCCNMDSKLTAAASNAQLL